MKNFQKVVNALGSVPLMLLVVLTFAAVIMRYVMGKPIQWTEEMSGFLMVWIVMIGAVAAERDDNHLTIPVLTDLLSPKVRAVADLIVSTASIALLLFMAWLGYGLMMQSQFKMTEILGIPWLWIDLALPVGCIGVAVYTGRRCLAHVKLLAGKD